MPVKGPINPRNEHRIFYVKSYYRHKASEWSEPSLELRWSRTFEEYMLYVGSPHNGPVSERMNQNGALYSDYPARLSRRSIQSSETAWQG